MELFWRSIELLTGIVREEVKLNRVTHEGIKNRCGGSRRCCRHGILSGCQGHGSDERDNNWKKHHLARPMQLYPVILIVCSTETTISVGQKPRDVRLSCRCSRYILSMSAARVGHKVVSSLTRLCLILPICGEKCGEAKIQQAGGIRREVRQLAGLCSRRIKRSRRLGHHPEYFHMRKLPASTSLTADC